MKAEKDFTFSEEDLPKSLKEIRTLLGLEAAMAVFREFGGQRIFIAKKIGPEHMLRNRLAGDLPDKLAKHFGGTAITVPRGAAALRRQRNLKIIAEYDEGKSVTALTLKYELTERQIYTIIGKTWTTSEG